MEDLAYVSPRYLTCAETAKLVRKALKRSLPGVKFSVRSNTYSMGASIDVTWTDGPTADQVSHVVGVFAGSNFDSMVDLKISTQSWLNPDGSASIAHTGAGGSTLSEYIGDPPHPNAELVRFGADYVHTHRRVSEAWDAKLRAEIAEFAGLDSTDFDYSVSLPVSSWIDRDTGGVGLARDNHGGEYATSLVWQLAAQRDRSGLCEHEQGTYSIGNGWHRCKGCGMRCATHKEALPV